MSSTAFTTNKAKLLSHFDTLATPFYYYDTQLLRHTLDVLTKSANTHGFHVHYALKANAHPELLQLIRDAGLGADCVSGNEVQRAIDCGFAPSKIAFAGVGKTDAEIKLALHHDIFCFNCESLQELEVIAALAADAGKTVRVALRVNPNVDARTHHYITTGLEENKFGIGLHEIGEVIALFKQHPHVQCMGLHVHIGSQITDLNVFRALCTKVNRLQQLFALYELPLPHLNVGGGLGVNYHEPDTEPVADFEAYFGLFAKFLERRPGQEIHFELGRSVVAQCGSLISRVLYVKKGLQTNFAVLDAGMTELIRPALYQAYHHIDVLSPSEGEVQKYDVVGPVCESTDCFAKALELPELKRGDLVALRTAGAYGEVMVSNYNLRQRGNALFSSEIIS
jgi:diaminopimelate decarboxylase